MIGIAGCAYTLIRNGAVDPNQAATIEAGVAKVRGLDFEREVPVVVKTPDEAEQLMREEIARDHSDQELRLGGETGAMTGLYPPHIDLKQKTLKLLHNQVIGFYNPDTKQMVLVEKPASHKLWDMDQLTRRRQLMGDMVLAHELTHALQDQHFDLNPALRRVKDNDDESLALKSLAEGDATISGFGYVAGHLDTTNIDLLVSKLTAMPETAAADMSGVPIGVSAPMLFQYSDGAHFVAEAWRRGGWAAVDRIYRDPPRSTQQIMQPQLYFDHPSPPAKIELRGYEKLLEGWKKVDDDTFGELLLKLILQQHLAPRAPALASLSQWAGDRIITLQKSQRLTLLWLIAFHDDTAADEFARGYRRVLDNLDGEPHPHGIDTRGRVVFVAIGDYAVDFPALANAVWKASTVSPAAPPQPPVIHVEARDSNLPS